jgi:alpha-glucuronidase
MTKEKLSQLHYLKMEIIYLQERILELETLATSGNSNVNLVPDGVVFKDKVGAFVAQIADLKTRLQASLRRCFEEIQKLNRYIESIENSEIRVIFEMRYIEAMSWRKIASKLNYQDESIPRKRHDRFLFRKEN